MHFAHYISVTKFLLEIIGPVIDFIKLTGKKHSDTIFRTFLSLAKNANKHPFEKLDLGVRWHALRVTFLI